MLVPFPAWGWHGLNSFQAKSQLVLQGNTVFFFTLDMLITILGLAVTFKKCIPCAPN